MRTRARAALTATSLITSLTISLVTSLVLLLPAPPASAEARTIHDPAGDGSSGTGGGERIFGDVGTVRVHHGPFNVRLAVFAAQDGRLADFYDFWVDTDPRDKGPEYVASVSLEVLPRAGVARAERFGDLGGRSTCEVRTARTKRQGIRVSFPRRCFGRAAKVRVATQTSMEYANADWAPRKRRFGPWVASTR